MSEQDPILEKARQLRAAGATVGEVRQYLHSKGYDTGDAPTQSHAQRLHDEYKVGNLGRRMASENDQDAAELEPTGIADAGARAFMATGANLAQGIPGMSAVQAFLRSKVRGQSYSEALADIQGETSKIPEPLRNIEKAVGAAPLALSLPGSTFAKAATTAGTLGWAGVMADADPDVSLEERTKRAPIAAGTGVALTAAVPAAVSTVDKVRRFLSLAKGVRSAPTIGRAAVDRDEAIAEATNENYSTARAESEAAGGTSPGVQAQLKRPLTKQYADEIRAEGDDLSDAEMLMAVDRRMTEARRGRQKSQERDFSDTRASEIRGLRREQKAVRAALAAASEKPPITLEIAGETHQVAPRITPGREAMSGPTQGARPARTLPGHETVTGPIPEGTAGRARGNASQVAIDPSGKATAVSPRDVQGPAGPSFVLRGQPEQVVDPGSPGRPAFQLRGQPDKVTPGVEIETPAMRVQTAPAEQVPPVSPSYSRAVSEKARMEGVRDVSREAIEHARRMMSERAILPKKLESQSAEHVVERWVKELTPEEAAEALQSVLGAGKEAGVSFSPLTLAGVGTTAGALVGGAPGAAIGAAGGTLASAGNAAAQSAMRLNRLEPLVRALQRQAGKPSMDPTNTDQLRRLMPAAQQQLVEYMANRLQPRTP